MNKLSKTLLKITKNISLPGISVFFRHLMKIKCSDAIVRNYLFSVRAKTWQSVVLFKSIFPINLSFFYVCRVDIRYNRTICKGLLAYFLNTAGDVHERPQSYLFCSSMIFWFV